MERWEWWEWVVIGFSVIVAVLAVWLQPHPISYSYAAFVVVGSANVIYRKYQPFDPEPKETQAKTQTEQPSPLSWIRERSKEMKEMTMNKPSAQVKERPKIVDPTPEQREGKRISEVLVKELRFNCVVDYLKTSNMYLTPTSIMYPLLERSAIDANALADKTDSIARAIAKHRSAKNVRVQLLDTQPLYLQVSRPDPQPHLWADRQWKRKPMFTCIGDRWIGGQREPITLELFGEDCAMANGLFCGQPRSGKSRNVHIALLGLLESTSAKHLHVWAVDMNSKAYTQYEGLPQFQGFYGEKADIVALLEQFAAWCTVKEAPTDGRHRLLIFDEFQMAMEDEEIGNRVFELIKFIMAAGPKYGIRVWIVTQVPDKNCYPPRLKPLTHFTVAHYMQNDGYVKQQLQIHGSSQLQEKHECILLAGGAQKVVTTYWLPDAEMQASLGELRAKYKVGTGGSTNFTNSLPTTATNSLKVGTTGTKLGTGGEKVGTNLVAPTTNSTSYTPSTNFTSTVGSGGNTRVKGVYVCKFPLELVRVLTDEEVSSAIEQINADRSAYLYGGKISQNKIAKFLFNEENISPKAKDAARIVKQRLDD